MFCPVVIGAYPNHLVMHPPGCLGGQEPLQELHQSCKAVLCRTSAKGVLSNQGRDAPATEVAVSKNEERTFLKKNYATQ